VSGDSAHYVQQNSSPQERLVESFNADAEML